MCLSDGAVTMQAMQERCAELETEAAVLSEELTRTSAVAARATAREVVNGSKDEGVVPVTLHIEEVRLPCFFFPASSSSKFCPGATRSEAWWRRLRV